MQSYGGDYAEKPGGTVPQDRQDGRRGGARRPDCRSHQQRGELTRLERIKRWPLLMADLRKLELTLSLSFSPIYFKHQQNHEASGRPGKFSYLASSESLASSSSLRDKHRSFFKDNSRRGSRESLESTGEVASAHVSTTSSVQIHNQCASGSVVCVRANTQTHTHSQASKKAVVVVNKQQL